LVLIESQVGANGPAAMGKSIFVSEKFFGSLSTTEPGGSGFGISGMGGNDEAQTFSALQKISKIGNDALTKMQVFSPSNAFCFRGIKSRLIH